jgi:hypothetical protein
MKVTGISGIGDTGMTPRNAAIGWTIVIGVTVLVIVGTLALKPKKA